MKEIIKDRFVSFAVELSGNEVKIHKETQQDGHV